MSHEDGAHDDQDDDLLRELARLRAASAHRERQREIIGELIAGWEPHFGRWLVVRIGRQDGEEVASRVVLRLVQLLLRRHEFSAAWGAVVWRTVKDEAYRFYREHEASRERPVADLYATAAAEPYEDQLDESKPDPTEDAQRLTDLVAELSKRDQRVIQLAVIEERPRSETAAMLGIKINALDQAKHRALRRLAELAARNGVSGNRIQDENTT